MVRDQSQIPIERLALLLLQRARQDAALLRRVPANDDMPANDLPPLAPPFPTRRFPPAVRWQPAKTADAPSVAVLEELISIALISAQDAEDVARAANRRAKRGLALAVGLGVLALAVAATGSIGAPLYGGVGRQIVDMARQVRAFGVAAQASPDIAAGGQAGLHEASVAAPAGNASLPGGPAARVKPTVWALPTG